MQPNPTTRLERAELTCQRAEQLFDMAQWEDARATFLNALALYPSLVAAHLGLAKTEGKLGHAPAAEIAIRSALEADPQSGKAAHALGILLAERDRFAEALPLFLAAAQREPTIAQHHRDLATTQLFLGDIAAGRESLFNALERDVHCHEVLYNFVRLQRMNDGSDASARALQIAESLAADSETLPRRECAQVFFALAKAYGDLDRIAESAAYSRRANAIQRALVDCDLTKTEKRYQRIAEIFDRAFLKRFEGKGVRDVRPIFIVGMPRSGSTLVEQILSAHPEVHAAGEIYRLPPLIENTRSKVGVRYPEWATSMNDIDCQTLARSYLERLPHGLVGKTRTTDKWLENLEYLGLIAACLPDAKIIHCQREPRDQLLSCWMTYFANGQTYSYDIGDLRRYWRAYQRLMAHWRDVLPPSRLIEVPYENLLRAPEEQVRALVEWCGLDWDPDVLHFWNSRRPVQSASVAQVRVPLYGHAVGRWMPYGAELNDLFDLGADARCETTTSVSD